MKTRPIAAAVLAGLLALSTASLTHAGGLIYVGEAPAPTPDNEGNSILVSPNGAHVYIAEDDTGGSIAVYSRNATTGALTYVQSVCYPNCGLPTAAFTSLAMSADGAHLYVAADEASPADHLFVYSRNAGTGALTFVEVHEDDAAGVVGLGGARGVTISADGKHVYVTGEDDESIALFSRNSGTGQLTFVQAYFNSVLGGLALHFAQEPVMSTDGNQVYVVGPHHVTSLTRNTTTGQLTLLQTLDDAGNGKHLAVSADGASVYVPTGGAGVGTYARNAMTGALTFVEHFNVGDLDVAGGTYHDIAVQPDGKYAYAPANSGVITFRRNTTTGRLTYVANELPAGHGDAVAVSPDGKHVYVDRRDVYTIDRCGDSHVGDDEHCDDGNASNGDGCSSTCQFELCGPAPSGTCRGPILAGKSQLQLRRGTTASRDSARWTWTKGEATTTAEFGNTLTTASYVLCIYDSSGAPQPLVNLAAFKGGTCEGRPCWKAASTHGYNYKNRLLTPNGWSTITLREGLTDGKPRISFKGKGLFLGLPSTPLTFPVTVQVKNTQTSTCLGAVYSTPLVNAATQVKAISD